MLRHVSGERKYILDWTDSLYSMKRGLFGYSSFRKQELWSWVAIMGLDLFPSWPLSTKCNLALDIFRYFSLMFFHFFACISDIFYFWSQIHCYRKCLCMIFSTTQTKILICIQRKLHRKEVSATLNKQNQTKTNQHVMKISIVETATRLWVFPQEIGKRRWWAMSPPLTVT